MAVRGRAGGWSVKLRLLMSRWVHTAGVRHANTEILTQELESMAHVDFLPTTLPEGRISAPLENTK
jgi:hypothetical protein